MNTLLLTYGTRGDVQPFVALGKGLREAGHNVTISTSTRFQSFIEDHGFHFEPMSDDLLAILDTDDGKEVIQEANGILGILKAKKRLSEKVKPMQRQLLSDSWDAAQKTNPDIIIYHPKAFSAPHIAQKLDVPAAMAVPFSFLVPTKEQPSFGLPDLGIGRWYNKLTYKFVLSMMGLMTNPFVKDWYKEQGMEAPDKINPLTLADGKPIPVLHCFSRHVMPRPNDWPDHAHVTGYWFLDDQEGWEPPEDLKAFLETGDPPVYIGFGSMAAKDPERLGQIAIEALQKTGKRGILASGWGGLKTEDLPDTVFKIDHAPHDWLFPQMAAIVHHGGAGTTAAALRAGKPSIICPFIADQPYWGKKVHKLGVGSAPINQKTLTAEKLADAIEEVTSNPDIQRKASELGVKIKQETGVENAVSIIEELVCN